MEGIFPMLWFDKEAEEAANFYCSIFDNSRITNVSHYPAGTPGPEGSVMVVNFEVAGAQFSALNAGPMFKFNEAVSFVVSCESQAEIDRYWDALLADGGQPSVCGWLKDKYGVSWQVSPAGMDKLVNGDPKKAAAAMGAVMKMVKLDMDEIKRAYDAA